MKQASKRLLGGQKCHAAARTTFSIVIGVVDKVCAPPSYRRTYSLRGKSRLNKRAARSCTIKMHLISWLAPVSVLIRARAFLDLALSRRALQAVLMASQIPRCLCDATWIPSPVCLLAP